MLSKCFYSYGKGKILDHVFSMSSMALDIKMIQGVYTFLSSPLESQFQGS